MEKPGATFSESWHRIADLRVSLRASVRVRRQIFRGELWHVLHDPFNNTFFRLRPEAYRFLSRLTPERTVEEVWEESLTRNPGEAPGQEEVLQLLTQLYYANLLYFKMPGDSAKLFERYKKRRQREVRSKLLSIMFIRLPLFDPDRMLEKVMPLLRLLVSPLGAMLWFAVVIGAAKCVFDRFDMVVEQAQGILAPANLFLLYIGMVLVKTLHEFGHAVVCKRFGGEVHTMGVMLLVFTPLPYMDATSSWSFRSRWRRAFVGGAGMITEVFFAGIATFVWAKTGAGTLHSLAYNIMFIASVSTVLFNGNPLLRFDGYYILSDLLDIPNLSTHAMQHLRHLTEKFLLGCKDSMSPARSGKEAFWLTVFAILSGIYRVVVFTGIILFVADKFLLAGLIMALVCVISWGVVPLFRLIQYLASSPKLEKNRTRAVAVCTAGVLCISFFIGVLPLPNRFRAPGVLQAVNYVRVVNTAPGYIASVLAPPGSTVQKGDPLIRLVDKELDIEIRRINAQGEEAAAMKVLAMSRETADLEPVMRRIETIDAKKRDLLTQKEKLVVRARRSGIWISPKESEMVGKWVPKGSFLGEIVGEGGFRFSSVVSQNDAANLFAGTIRYAQVRVFGQGGTNIGVERFNIIPFQHNKLPSASLGWFGGGEVAVSMSDETGLKASEPFFLIFADVFPREGVSFFHGRSGKIRFTMEKTPLLFQWGRSLRQLLQRRYRI